jgi:hypothetical protein
LGAAIVALIGTACGGDDANDTEVLGLVIDRESASASASASEPTDDPTEPAPAPSATSSASPSPEPTVAPTVAPTTPPPPPPPPSEPTYPAEVADPGAYSGAMQEWAIGDDGVAYARTAVIAPTQTERNADGTSGREPDWYDVIDVTPVNDQNVEAVCSAVATADDHRDLLIRGTVTIDLLVDEVVVATAGGPIDTVVGSGTTASLLSTDPHGPVLVGTQAGEAVTFTCRVTLAS